MFYDRFKELCDQRGITCNRAALDIGLSNATPTAWKKRGLTPKADTLAMIANYFGVTTDYLLGEETKIAPTFTSLLPESSGYWDGERLAELRNECGFSIEQISSWLEISDTEYKFLESGSAEPSFRLLLRMADIFAFDLDYLCHRTSKSESCVHSELEILNLYCKLDDTGRASALAALKGLLDAFPGEETIFTPKEA